jgi:hypothetical protein
MLVCQKQVNGFLELASDIVLDLGVRAPWCADRLLGGFSPIVEAGQVDHCVTAADKGLERLGQRA